MHKLLLLILVIVIGVGFGLVFNSTSTINDKDISFALPFDWKSAKPCKLSTTCVPNNICISPVANPDRGVPFRYERANLATCSEQTSLVARILDWVVGFVVGGLIAFIVQQFIKQRPGDQSYANGPYAPQG